MKSISYQKLRISTLVLSIFSLFSCGTHLNEKSTILPVQKQKIYYNKPPQKVPVPHSTDAPLLGNGSVGVALSGNPEHQKIYINRNDFWRLQSSFNASFPTMIGQLHILFPQLKNAKYHVEQDLYNAITTAQFTLDDTALQYTIYVCAQEDAIVLRLTNIGQQMLHGSAQIQFLEKENRVPATAEDLTFSDNRDQGTENHIQYLTRGFSKDVDIPTQATVAMRLLNSTNDLSNISLTPAESKNIVLYCTSNFKTPNSQKQSIDYLAQLSNKKLDNLWKEHTQWWHAFWKKSWVEIPDTLIEKQYYKSNYTMASCSRDSAFAPAIFGPWITQERPIWNGDYHLNYNYIAPFYGLYSSNHTELATPFYSPCLDILERGEYYSEKVTHIKGGVLLPVGIGPKGIETVRKSPLLDKVHPDWFDKKWVEDEGLFFGQKSNAAYCVTNMAMHYYSTYDLNFAKKVYPFVKAVATFWENYLTKDRDRYVIYNDAIHEGTVGTMNPILSLGLVKQSLGLAITMATDLNIDSDKKSIWKEKLEHLSSFPIQERNGKKVFRYTEKGVDWWNGNTLGIQHIFPAEQIGLASDKELIKTAQNTLIEMNRWIDFNGSNSFFPAAVYVGIHPDTIYTNLHQYCIHTYPNGFQKDNPHGIENLSTVPNTINHMLCNGHQGVLRIFRVWNKKQNASFYNLRTEGAFVVSSSIKNGEVQSIHMLSEQGKTCKLENPWKGHKIKITRDNHTTQQVEGDYITIDTSKGETLEINKL